MDDPYEKGHEFVDAAIEAFFKEGLGSWRSFGIFTHDPGTIIDNRKTLVNPEMFLESFVKLVRQNDHQAVLVLDATRSHSYSPSTPEGNEKLFAFMKDIGSLPTSLLLFGPPTEHVTLYGDTPQVKVDIDWLLNHKGFAARVIQEASLVTRSIKAKDLSDVFDLNGFSLCLIKSLGPPSFTEEALEAAKGAGTDQIASDITSSISSPFSAIYKGFRYAYKFAKLRQKRKGEEVQKEYEEWETMLETSFATEKLNKFVATKGLNPLLNQLSVNKFAVVLNTTTGTPYELFFPFLLRNLYDEWSAHSEKEHIFVCFDNATKYLIGKTTTDLIRPPPKTLTDIHFVGHFYTKDPPHEELLLATALDYLRERAIIVDMTPQLFDGVFKHLSFSTRAYLQKQFETIGKKTLKDDLYYLTYNRIKKNPWQLNKLQIGLTNKIYSSLRKAMTKVVDKITDRVATQDLDLPEEELRKLEERDQKDLAERQAELDAEREAELEDEKKIK